MPSRCGRGISGFPSENQRSIAAPPNRRLLEVVETSFALAEDHRISAAAQCLGGTSFRMLSATTLSIWSVTATAKHHTLSKSPHGNGQVFDCFAKWNASDEKSRNASTLMESNLRKTKNVSAMPNLKNSKRLRRAIAVGMSQSATFSEITNPSCDRIFSDLRSQSDAVDRPSARAGTRRPERSSSRRMPGTVHRASERPEPDTRGILAVAWNSSSRGLTQL